MAKPIQAVKKVPPRRVGPVKAPIPFRDRVDLYDGVKMRKIGPQEEGTSVLQSYLNVVPEQKTIIADMKQQSSTRVSKKSGKKASSKNNWLSNLNVYIDPTSATSFLHNPGKSGKSCSSSGKKEDEIKWTARDDPGLWREFLIVLLMISIMIAACFGLMQYVLRQDPPPTPTTA